MPKDKNLSHRALLATAREKGFEASLINSNQLQTSLPSSGLYIMDIDDVRLV